MSFESMIGWRYLYRGKQSPRTWVGLGVGILAMALGAYLLVSSHGGSPSGVLTLVLGMVATVTFALLSLFSVFTAVSVMGVVFGVAALTVVLSVTTGFQDQFKEKVLGVNAHVIIMKNAGSFDDYRSVEETAKNIDPDVVAVQPFIFVEMLVTRGRGEISGVAIKGVDPVRVTEVLDLEKHMVEGTAAALREAPADGTPPPIIMGRELAHKLKAHLGDEVTVVVPLSNIELDTWKIKNDPPKTRKFVVAGVFYSGFDEYDRRLMYISLEESQALLDRGDTVMGVELKVKDVDRADEIAAKLRTILTDPPFSVQDWNDLNHNLFKALTSQKLALLIILTLIIIVATFNMVSALTMMVTDKTREIAILKSMGATSTSVARVFQVVGLVIGGIGTIAGLSLGLTVCYVVSNYGYRLDPRVYLIDRLPISVQTTEVILVAVITMVISFVATLFPSAKASSLRPADGLRYD